MVAGLDALACAALPNAEVLRCWVRSWEQPLALLKRPASLPYLSHFVEQS